MTSNRMKYCSLDTAKTTDNTPTIVNITAIPKNSACQMDISVIARDLDTGDSIINRKIYTVKNVEGTLTLNKTITNLITNQGDVSLLAVSSDVSASDSNIVVSVAGLLATNIIWLVNTEILVN